MSTGFLPNGLARWDKWGLRMMLRNPLLLVAVLLVSSAALAPASGALVVPSSCSSEGERDLGTACVFSCQPGQTVHVTAGVSVTTNRGSAVSATATCGGASAACAARGGSFQFPTCSDSRPTSVLAPGLGTCEAQGFAAVWVSCWSA